MVSNTPERTPSSLATGGDTGGRGGVMRGTQMEHKQPRKQDSPGPNSRRPRQPRRPHFDLRALLLIMVIFSLAGAAASYLAQALRGGGRAYQLAFLLLTLVSPVLLLLVTSGLRWWAERGRRRPEDGAGEPGEDHFGAD
jgi:hypothetical protein